MTLLNHLISKLSEEHCINSGGIIAGQCLSAVGWVGETVPPLREEQGLLELSMADVAGGGIVAGLAIAGRRPIYVVRYQGFLWYNLVTIANYCAKSLFLWDIPAPIWVRAICMEGAIGPVAGNGHHSLAARMPGLKLIAPATNNEYIKYFRKFQSENDIYIVSEHRRLYTSTVNIENRIQPNSSIAIVAISSTRIDASVALDALKREYGINIDLFGLIELAPLNFPGELVANIGKYKHIVILDVDYNMYSVSSQVELALMKMNKKIETHNFALPIRTAGFSKETDLRTPSPEEILNIVKGLHP